MSTAVGDQKKKHSDKEELRRADFAGQIAAIRKSQAVIEFELDGTILDANDNFLSAVGYTLEEIRGKHHRMFVDAALAESDAYRTFWKELGGGEYRAGEFKRFGKGGREIWIQASYNPILDPDGKPFKVVKYATDITAQKLKEADLAGQIAAIGKSQAVIEFELDGTILDANENFLNTVGYTLEEIRGKHHRMFADAALANSDEYRDFWQDLGRGNYRAGEFKRVGKGGREIWIQASYNPILDPDGKPFKVVKYATDITETVQQRDEITELQEAAVAESSQLREKVDLLLAAVDRAAEGDLTVEIAVQGTDAIGRLGAGLAHLFASLRQSIGKISENADTLAASSEQLKATSDQMGESARQTETQAQSTAMTAEQVNSSTSSIATAAEELNASITEISRSATNAVQVATEAVTMAASTNEQVARLGDSSNEIGGVIKVIASIAQQTNLLALNATIEAARAGEAGKGFAVVANEVKELAKETATATEEISRKIEAIQTNTKTAVEAIGKIGTVIGTINELQETIAAAVEEQSATTGEIGRSITEASSGSSEIAEGIAVVASAAQTANQGVSQTRDAAVALTRMGESLRSLVKQFRV